MNSLSRICHLVRVVPQPRREHHQLRYHLECQCLSSETEWPCAYIGADAEGSYDHDTIAGSPGYVDETDDGAVLNASPYHE